jgi:hypothetical protein
MAKIPTIQDSQPKPLLMNRAGNVALESCKNIKFCKRLQFYKVLAKGNSANMNMLTYEMHCNENNIHVFLFWELRGLSPTFHIHVSVSQNRQADPGNILISHRYMRVGIGRQNIIIMFWK